MIQKGYLKSSLGVYPLSCTTTTIGRENCDLVIDDNASDGRHAVIEYSFDEDCFVLHDLNTVQGTYVNNCRIQNSAVRLAPGDIIKFSHDGKQHELYMECSSKVHQYLPVQQRPSWNSPIQIVVSSPRQEKTWQDSNSFPLIGISSSKTVHSPTPAKTSCVQPHPPLSTRPISMDGMPQPCQGAAILPNSTEMARSASGDRATPCRMGSMLREKEKKIIHMGDEINRLAMYEQESKRKDNTVSCLREEVARLQDQLTNEQHLTSSQIFQKLQSLEKELQGRRNEVDLLRQQLHAVSLGSSPTLTSQVAECEKKVHSLRQEVDQSRKECAMAQGLVQSLQKEIQVKEDSSKKITAELAHLRREVKRKDVQLSSISSKFTKLSGDSSKDETIDSLKREMKEAKIKHRMLDSRSTDQLKLLQTYKDEVANIQAKLQNSVEERKVATKNMEDLKQKYFEVQRSERILRVDLEQSQSRLDRFRMRVVNTLYSSPGLSVPDDPQMVEDNVVVEDLKKLIKQRLEMKSKGEEFEENLKKKDAEVKDLTSSFVTCQTAVDEMMERVSKNGHLTRLLRSESDLLFSLALADARFAWIYKSFATFLNSEADWSTAIDQALLQAGHDISVHERHPASHIEDLHSSLQAEKESHQTTLDSYKELESRHQEELQSNIDKLLKENEEKLAAQLEAVRQQEEARFQDSLQELHRAEEDKRARELEEERKKMVSANLGIEQLRKMLAEQQNEEKELKIKLHEAFTNIEKQKNIEEQLRKDLSELERDHRLKVVAANERFDQTQKTYEADINQHKEEIYQHSITIVSMEEKIQLLTLQRQQYEDKISSLKSKLKDVPQRARPSQPEPVHHRADQEVAFLKAELLQAGQEILTLKDTIVGLRRDLTGSQARISDMTGELSESQKLELEHNRSRCKNQEIELNTIRQKLLKMSQIVDAQKEQIGKLNKEIKVRSSDASRKEEEVAKKDESIKQLEERLQSEELMTNEKSIVEVKKGKITEELSSVGAQCKGERHEEIISRQCQALAELRARIKALEQIRPPLPSQEQALQQVILLKKELAEIRARQAIDEDKHFQAQMSLDSEVLDSQQQIRAATMQASVERTTREQLEASLEAAERSYMDVVNNLSSILGLSSLHGSSTLQHLPPDERERVSLKRKEDLEKLCSNIKSTLQQMDRKEQLLQGYEKDLARLREAEDFASSKSNRVEVLSRQLMDKSEEVNHLREALSQSNEKLELEKRLNKAIKQRKTFHLENLDYRKPITPARSCYRTEAEERRMGIKEEKQNKKLMRKQYEVEVLKKKVYGKERELCDTTARLVNLKATDGNDEVSQIHQLREYKRKEDLSRDLFDT